MDTTNGIIVIFSYLFAIIFLFFICREIVCWYFKINKTIEVLEEIRDHLKKLNIGQTENNFKKDTNLENIKSESIVASKTNNPHSLKI